MVSNLMILQICWFIIDTFVIGGWTTRWRPCVRSWWFHLGCLYGMGSSAEKLACCPAASNTYSSHVNFRLLFDLWATFFRFIEDSRFNLCTWDTTRIISDSLQLFFFLFARLFRMVYTNETVRNSQEEGKDTN